MKGGAMILERIVIASGEGGLGLAKDMMLEDLWEDWILVTATTLYLSDAKEDDVEDSAGGNNFEMMQEQTRRADVTEDGGDVVAGSGFARDSWV